MGLTFCAKRGMGDSSSDNAIVFHDQKVRHRGIGESLLLGVSASTWAVGD